MNREGRVPSLSESPSGLVAFLHGLNLPDALQKSFLGALHRLITGATDYPAAWLERGVQGVRDGTAARTAVSEALTSVATSEIQKNRDLAERAVSAWLPEAVRRQTNREAVAQVAIEAIAGMAEGSEATTESVDPDWMNMFVRYAEDASSERMQQLWGRVLAREVLKAGSFSLRTVRFLSELDAPTAEAFERIALLVFGEDGIDLPERLTHDQFEDVFLLDQAGLMSHGDLATYFSIPEDGVFAVEIGRGEMIVTGPPGKEIGISCAVLTRTGTEVLRIVSAVPGRSVAENIADRVSKVHITRIEWDPDCSGACEVLWAKEQ